MGEQNSKVSKSLPIAIDTLDYGRKWYFPVVSLGIFLLLYGFFITDILFWVLFSFLTVSHFFSYWIMDQLDEGLYYNEAWYLSFIIDLSIVALLVLYSGGLDSSFVIAYGILMVSVGVVRPQLKEVLVCGTLGYLTCLISLLLYYNNFSFLATREFWTQCLLIGGIFINTVLVTRVIQEQKKKLKEAKQEVEELAEELKVANKELERLSYTDEVTGVYNHRYFQERLQEEVGRCERYDYPVALLMLDLDNFKEYNDTFGHPRGDEVLKQVAQILENNVRNHDVVARYGGDEFSLILIDAEQEAAVKIAGRIRKAILDYKFKDESELSKPLTISIGIANYLESADTAQNLIKKADKALYEAKAKGKNTITTYKSMLQELKNDLGNKQPKLINKVETLISIIDNRDEYTYAHSERVGKLAIALGEAMDLSQQELQCLKYAAFLHDLGKVEIDADILNKPGRLNEEEKEAVKKIPVYSKEIIEEVDLKKVISAVLHHRENYDGSGYPYGLSQEEIPFLARVLSLVDSFDAMLSARPYRKSLTLEEARRELLEESGRQFDPQLVDTFLNLIFEDGSLPIDYKNINEDETGE